MKHQDFVSRYKRANIDFLFDQPFTMELLVSIHQYLFFEEAKGGMLRYKKEDTEYQRIEQILKNIVVFLGMNLTDEEYIKAICQSVAIIYMYQPFYNGNTRTCLVLQKLLLRLKNMEFLIEEHESKVEKDLIPIFYDESDEIGEKSLIAVKKKILKVTNLYMASINFK